ncbi:MAG TPA: TlpA family protein disulfide reductase [Deltaproteobacteria bacterium]|nr:TlpA family protein disulfide reductase [Deltaproteobacteria bacterium]
MNKKTITALVILTVLIIGVTTFCFGQFIPNAPFKKEVVTAPDFSLKDLKGKTFRLSRYSGDTVLLFFGTTWCPACRTEIPAYKKIYETYTPQGMEVVYINIGESAKRVKRFVKKNSLPYRVLLDKNETVANSYNIMGVPTFILLNKDRVVVNISHRTMDIPLEELFPKEK